MVSVRPTGDRVLVKLIDKGDEILKSGIILPANTAKLRSAKVIAVGRGTPGPDGSMIASEVKSGDIVQLVAHGGDEMTVDSEKYLLVSERLILAVIEQQPKAKTIDPQGLPTPGKTDKATKRILTETLCQTDIQGT